MDITLTITIFAPPARRTVEPAILEHQTNVFHVHKVSICQVLASVLTVPLIVRPAMDPSPQIAIPACPDTTSLRPTLAMPADPIARNVLIILIV